MYALAGVTGHVGSVAAKALLAKGKKVRVIVRTADKGEEWKKLGAKVAVGDLSDVEFLTEALTGVKGAFLLLPPPSQMPPTPQDFYDWQRDLASRIGNAALAAKVPHVVVLSSVSAHVGVGNGPIKGLFHLENALSSTDVNFTAVRACSFMENLGGMLGAMTHMGIFPDMITPGKSQNMVATKDIAEVVVQALLDPPSKRKHINLVGPAAVTSAEVVDLFSKALGKPIKLVSVPAEGMVGGMVQGGLPPVLAEVFAEMYTGINNGTVAYPEGEPIVRGTTTLAQFIPTLVAK